MSTQQPQPPKRKTAADIISSSSRHIKPTTQKPNYASDPRKKLWCDSQWSNLSVQAKRVVKLPTLPYFEEESMLLSRVVNERLWGQLERLWDSLGPDRAPFATPLMLESGEVKWYSFLEGDKGDEAEIYGKAVDAFMSRNRKPGEYEG